MRTCQSSVITAVQYPVRSIGADALAGATGVCPPRPWPERGIVAKKINKMLNNSRKRGILVISLGFALSRSRCALFGLRAIALLTLFVFLVFEAAINGFDE